MTETSRSCWVDFDTDLSWIGETIMFRHRHVVILIDPWWRNLTVWTPPDATDEEIASAMERVRQVLPRPDTAPTRRLPRIDL